MTDFNGFPQELLEFYQELSLNNDRAWFERNRDRYSRHVVRPAIAFVEAMGERLRLISPHIVADPRTSGAGSLFRIYRDTRFSKDKTPYKTFLGIFFGEDSRNKMENSGFYFHLEPTQLMLYAGIYEFPKPLLDVYRRAVVHPERGAALRQAVQQVRSAGRYEVGGQHYKKVPAGYDANHENAEFLLYSALYASSGSHLPPQLFTPHILDYCLDRFADMSPVHRWIVSVLEGEPAGSWL
jgi:uncharacterized protein (TIGR02453 family)